MTPRKLTILDLRMELVAKLAGWIGLGVVCAAFAFSFAQLQWIAAALGVHPWVLSFLFPLIIDGPSVVASGLTVALHDRPFRIRVYAWSILIVFTSLSWMCNAIHAVDKADKLFAIVPSYPLALALVILISGIPPVGVVLGMHLWAYALRHSVGADQTVTVAERSEQKAKKKTKRDTTEQTETEKPDKTEQTVPDKQPEKTGRHARPDDDAPVEAWEIKARALFVGALAGTNGIPLDKNGKPGAAAIAREVDPPMNAQNFRKRIAAWWKEYQDNPASIMDSPADETGPETVNAQVSEAPGTDSATDKLRDELHVADPPETDDQPADNRQVAGVA